MNTPSAKFQTAMNDLPLVAILRGLTPAEAPIIGDALVEIGFRLLEVPLNSPQPLESIALLRARFPQALVGAGTVLRAQDVREVRVRSNTCTRCIAPSLCSSVNRIARRRNEPGT
jgi:2-dehydro-3-deoxyphosphogalactonate aldolase